MTIGYSRRDMTGARHSIGALALVLPLTLAGCCFAGSHSEVTTTVTEPPPDPSLEALQACYEHLVTDNHCATPISEMPGATFEVGVCYRTHNLARFATAGEWTASVGEGAARVVLRRGASGTTAGTAPPPPGETLTWSVHHTMYAPAAGWPVGVPVVFELHDATGALAAATRVTFTAPQMPAPNDRPLGVIQLCDDAGLGGPTDDPFCTTPATTFAAGAGHLYATYSSYDAALWAVGATMIVEHEDRHHHWVEDSRLTLDPLELEPGETETVKGTWDLDAAGWREQHTWRARLESNGVEIASTPFTTTH